MIPPADVARDHLRTILFTRAEGCLNLPSDTPSIRSLDRLASSATQRQNSRESRGVGAPSPAIGPVPQPARTPAPLPISLRAGVSTPFRAIGPKKSTAGPSSPLPCRDQLRRRQPELLGGLLDRIAFVSSFDFAEQQSSVDASVTDSPSRQRRLGRRGGALRHARQLSRRAGRRQGGRCGSGRLAALNFRSPSTRRLRS